MTKLHVDKKRKHKRQAIKVIKYKCIKSLEEKKINIRKNALLDQVPNKMLLKSVLYKVNDLHC